MNVIFLTLLDFNSFGEYNIYCDLLRQFKMDGHEVYCISPVERRRNEQTHMKENGHLLKLRVGNTQKTNVIEKGISTLLIEQQFMRAIKKYFSNIKFDLVLYSTPPITLGRTVAYLKKRDGAHTYLLLKDIFPQNAVDIGMLSKTGLKGLIYRYFRNKEKKLYAMSDYIGCMSKANADYVINNNREIAAERVEVCPNCIEIRDMRLTQQEQIQMREKYKIPQDKRIFVYGGNLGKPQDVPFVIECMKSQEKNEDAFFFVVGDGTEYDLVESYCAKEKPHNVKLMKKIAKEDYDRMIAACDVGMIFLDHRFTIPNFPSRLLAYMQAGLPVLACTDLSTDVGKTVVDGGFGWWCESKCADDFARIMEETQKADIEQMGSKALEYLREHYTAKRGYEDIIKHFR